MNTFILAATQKITQINSGNLPTGDANEATIKVILSIVFGVVGALALLIITISGLRYITAAGDPQKTSQAKNGIVYSLVGLAVALAAQAIVSFVVNRIDT